jgi:hypothetical protein
MKTNRIKIRKQVFMYLHYFILVKKTQRLSVENEMEKNGQKSPRFMKKYVQEESGGGLHLLKKFLLLFSLFFACLLSNAQSDQLGLRLGSYSGFTYRHFNAKDFGIELNLLKFMPARGTSFSLLGEKNFQLNRGFSMYAGGGLFFDNYRGSYSYRRNDKMYHYDFDGTYWGLEGIVGADYRFADAPVILGLDLRPRFISFSNPYPWDAGINVRYVF